MFRSIPILVLFIIAVSFGLNAGLSQHQRDFFWENGYLIIEDFVSEEERCELLQEIECLAACCDVEGCLVPFLTGGTRVSTAYFLDSADKICYFFEKGALDENYNLLYPVEKSINKIAHNLHDLNPTFQSFTYQKKFQEIPLDLGWTHPSVLQSMVIFKQPFIGGEVPPHQDLTFLYSEPNSTMGFWIPLEDATLQNGCLWVVPGGHKTSLRQRFVKNEEGTETYFVTFDPTPLPFEEMIPLEMKKGSLLLIHSLLPHMSLKNISEKSRIAYTFHIIDRNSEYPWDNWLQRGENTPLVPFEEPLY